MNRFRIVLDIHRNVPVYCVQHDTGLFTPVKFLKRYGPHYHWEANSSSVQGAMANDDFTSLLIRGIVGLDDDELEPHDPFKPQWKAILDDWVVYILKNDESLQEIQDGKHNDMLVSTTKQAAHKHTLAHLPPLGKRGFRIHAQAGMVIKRHRIRPSHPQTSWDETIAELRITFDYDTEQMIGKPWDWDPEPPFLGRLR
ncbi:hypothetical protein H2200_001387 [Cladophialophora chaetospira]|uniref:Uncharacterized protein n=1 Tax=Cladophialophora chaetospira TaxID=386627 RepID=A0AA38XKS4_9EURO|nr:hypothetical protein H2200_001387 [Cladophialophora chaetospira]